MTVRYIHWQADGMWLGYLEEFPDYWTQGTSSEDLQDHLRDLYCDLTSGAIPQIRRAAEKDPLAKHILKMLAGTEGPSGS